ncbi:MAG TPA: ParB/RepB/Spo0J family partition protein [Bacteroidia bacterium]|jgi:ParB family chromosome partitioning protein|nr:ParB/RepB/Spo0J family partition protein [Bacteroidia bacterium]
MSDNNKKRALGRGLSALLESDTTDSVITANSNNGIHATGGIAQIFITQIEANPFQPRSRFEEIPLKELTDSIRQHGVIQPITVRRVSKDKYQLISGERRLKATQLAGLTEIPAYVRVANDQSMLEMALIENTHREDLDAIEIAIGYQRLIEECSLTQENLSEKVGKDRTTVTNYLRLLRLPPVIQLAIREKKITMGHARALINIDNPAGQLSVFDKILDESLSVRETEEKAKTAKVTYKTGKHSAKNKNANDSQIEHELSSLLSAKVILARAASGKKGKIVIPFASDEQLRKIIETLHA